MNQFVGKPIELIDGLEVYRDIFVGSIKTIYFVSRNDDMPCDTQEKPNMICIVENNVAKCQSVVEGKYICLDSFSKN